MVDPNMALLQDGEGRSKEDMLVVVGVVVSGMWR
jgi:hypothetical protein